MTIEQIKQQAQSFTELLAFYNEHKSNEGYLYDQANDPYDNMSRGDLDTLTKFIVDLSNL